MPVLKHWGDKRSPAQIRADARYNYKGMSTAWLLRKRQLLASRLIVAEELLAQRGYGIAYSGYGGGVVGLIEALHLIAEKDRLP